MSKIIVALDDMSFDKAIAIATQLQKKVWGFKVNDLLVEHGVDIIKTLKRYGNVFADPKLHDIPNTVKNSVWRLRNAGADMITVHVSGGPEMLKAAVAAAGEAKIIGVTMLTSLNFDDIRYIYRGYPLERWSNMVLNSKLHGVVCAGDDLPFWDVLNLIKVIPGIRPNGRLPVDDQARITNEINTLSKADYLVVGRPVTDAINPVAMVEAMTYTMKL